MVQQGLALFGARAAVTAPPRVARRPRAYQVEMGTKAREQLQTARSTLAVMATGTGKTFTAADQVIRTWRNGRVLWLNERDNLVSQVRGELEDILGEQVFIEQAEVRAPSSARVVVGSLQSMCKEGRLAKFDRGHFGLIIPDEAHHSVAPSYVRIFEHFANAKILGLTATPRRLDGKSLGLVFDEQCADYQMHQGIADGYLAPLAYERARRIDVSKLKARGEFSDDQIAGVMGDDVLHAIVQDILDKAPGKRGVLFFPRVDIAKVAAQAFNNVVPGIARSVDGEMERDLKRAILRDHKKGGFLIACNVGVIEEGHDDAGIEFVGMCRPTKSWAKFVQWVGRCVRPLCKVDDAADADGRRAMIAASTKHHGYVYDFVGNTGKHRVMDAVDALAGTLDSEEVKAKAREILDADERGDVEKALETARRLGEAEQKEAAARVARVEAARYEWKRVDPFALLGMEDGQTDVANDLNRASERQRGLLGREGIRCPPSLTFDDAQRMIRNVKMRQKRGLVNFEGIRLLSKHGIPAHHMYQSTATMLLAEIRKHGGWTPPQDVIDHIIGAGRSEAGEEG